MDEQIVTRSLSVELTAKERHERSLELAEKFSERDRIESAKKESAAEFKAEAEACDSRLRTLSGIVRSGSEYREVECIWQVNETEKTMELVRRDTKVVIESRPLTFQERQVSILPHTEFDHSLAADEEPPREGKRRKQKTAADSE